MRKPRNRRAYGPSPKRKVGARTKAGRAFELRRARINKGVKHIADNATEFVIALAEEMARDMEYEPDDWGWRAKVARRLGLEPGLLGAVLRGDQNAGLVALQRVAETAGVSYDKLFGA